MDEWYRNEIIRRTQLLQPTIENHEYARTILSHVGRREHIVDWICDWCWTVDPRNASRGLPTQVPWILFPNQVKFIEWVYNRYLNNQWGLVEKCRDAGATWLFCAIQLWEWRWTDGYLGGFGSNKLNSVDDKDNPKSIFVKLRGLLYTQPPWWLPQDFVPRVHDTKASLKNPENDAHIGGEGGDDIGRGDRRTLYVVDEFASVEHQEAAEAALSATTDSCLYLSTPKGMNFFGKKRKSGKVPVFTFAWRDDPRKDEQWLADQKAKLDPVVVAQEILISYDASVEGLFIDPAWVEAATELELPDGGVRSTGVDVARGGSNKSAIARRSGPYITVEEYNHTNAVDLAHHAIDISNAHAAEYMNYDIVGVGWGVESALDRSERELYFKPFGVDAGGSPSDDYYPELGKTGKQAFTNARSEWWYRFAHRLKKTYEYVCGDRMYDPQELVSLPNNGTLRDQLTSPKKLYTEGGKMRCESKDAMRKRGIESGDSADAVIMSFLPQNAGIKRVFPSYTGPTSPFKVGFQRLSPESVLLISQWVEPNMTSSIILGLWNPREKRLAIWGELITNTPQPEKVVVGLTAMVRLIADDKSIRLNSRKRGEQFEWYANKAAFNVKSESGDLRTAYQKLKIHLRETPDLDLLGAITLSERLLQRKGILIHPRCETLNRQVRSWQFDGSTPANGFGAAMALCNIVSGLYEWKRFKSDPPKYKPYSKSKTQHQQVIEQQMKDGTYPKLQGKRRTRPGNNSPNGWMV
jgi:hypothetical protein